MGPDFETPLPSSARTASCSVSKFQGNDMPRGPSDCDELRHYHREFLSGGHPGSLDLFQVGGSSFQHTLSKEHDINLNIVNIQCTQKVSKHLGLGQSGLIFKVTNQKHILLICMGNQPEKSFCIEFGSFKVSGCVLRKVHLDLGGFA